MKHIELYMDCRSCFPFPVLLLYSYLEKYSKLQIVTSFCRSYKKCLQSIEQFSVAHPLASNDAYKARHGCLKCFSQLGLFLCMWMTRSGFCLVFLITSFTGCVV